MLRSAKESYLRVKNVVGSKEINNVLVVTRLDFDPPVGAAEDVHRAAGVRKELEHLVQDLPREVGEDVLHLPGTEKWRGKSTNSSTPSPT